MILYINEKEFRDIKKEAQVVFNTYLHF